MIQYLNVVKTFLITVVLSFALSFSANAVEPDGDSAVSQNFKDVGRSFRGVRDAKTAPELLSILQTARTAFVANRDEVPSFMEAGTPQHQEFLDGLDETIANVDKAIVLAEANDYDAAMAQFQEVRGAKDKYHEKFELED